jgi:O-antigen/teichoic acid export membrane protein
MGVRSTLRLLAAYSTGQGVSLVARLLVPPIFIARYANGVEVFGEWTALSAAITYLDTLNFGIQSYANNQMTIYYNRGDYAAAKALQSGALRLVLLVIGLLTLPALFELRMPIASWLNLTYTSSSVASLTLCTLTLQALVSMLFSLLANSYMVVGKMHRGANWLTSLRLVATLALSYCAWAGYSFTVLALTQLASTIFFTLLVFLDLRKSAPILVPSLRDGSWDDARAIIRPSTHFGLLALSGFLIWQGPLLLIQRYLGPQSVAIFSLTRTIFSMSRQGLAVLSQSLGQEITLLMGRGEWARLRRIYEVSERIVLSLVPIVSVGVLLLSPLLFAAWLHKRYLYDPTLCLLMALVSAVMGVKEHKYQFQSSTNKHESLSKFTLVNYIALFVVCPVLLKSIGIWGFMIAWLITEIVQTAYIMRLNEKLFSTEYGVSTGPVMRLVLVSLFAFSTAAWPTFASTHWTLGTVTLGAVAIILIISIGSYFAFGLNEVRSLLFSKIRERFVTPNGI